MGQETEIQQIRDDMKNKVPWQVFLIAMTLVLAAFGWLMTNAASTQARSDNAVDRASVLEGDIKEIKTDVRWIREQLK
jgi:hypothetical protein